MVNKIFLPERTENDYHNYCCSSMFCLNPVTLRNIDQRTGSLFGYNFYEKKDALLNEHAH